MTDEIVETEIEEVKPVEKKKVSKWTLEKATAFLNRNGHAVGTKQVHLSPNAGIGALGCSDYLRKIHGFSVFYSERK